LAGSVPVRPPFWALTEINPRVLLASLASGMLASVVAGLMPALEAARLEELRRARHEPLPEVKLRRAKDHLKGSLMLSLESTGSRMNHIARQEICFGRQFGLDELMAGIEAVSARNVTRIASKLFDGPLHASVLGNLKGYRPKPAQLRL